MSELESILNYLETTSMEPHDDYTSEFSYKEQKVLWKYIKQLQQENKKYKEVIDKAKKLHNEFASKNSLLVFENNNLIDFMNNLISVLKEVEDK